MYCPKCGAQNNDANLKCSCGQVLRPIQVDDALSTLIPYKNTPALIAYYLAVFSGIPCFGIFLGIAALILGIKGLKVAKEHPEAKGKVHAWVGILAGGFFGFLSLMVTISLFIINTGVRK